MDFLVQNLTGERMKKASARVFMPLNKIDKPELLKCLYDFELNWRFCFSAAVAAAAAYSKCQM